MDSKRTPAIRCPSPLNPEIFIAADLGDKDAQAILDQRYDYLSVIGITKVPKYYHAALKGSSDDQYLMGIYSKNVVEKFAWFLLALENGHIHGGYSVSEVGRLLSVEQQFQIAVNFANGVGGFPRSFESAKYWNEKALSKGHTKAQEFQSELLKMEQDFKLANTRTKQTNLSGIETSLKDGFGVVVEKVMTGVKIIAAIIFVIIVWIVIAALFNSCNVIHPE
jgi:TPR repeat protein